MKIKTNFLLSALTVLLVALCFTLPLLAQDTTYYSVTTEEGGTDWYQVITTGSSTDTLAMPVPPAFVSDGGGLDEIGGEVPADPVDEEALDKKYLAIYAVAVVVVPFLAGFLPWPWIKADATRDKLVKALTVAVVIGFAFVQYGFADVWELAVTWAVSKLFLYDGVMKAGNIRTPSPANPKS